MSCLSNVFVEVFLFVMLIFCDATPSRVMCSPSFEGICVILSVTATMMKSCNIEIIQVLKQKCHLVGKKHSLFELVESSADFCTKDIHEHWQRGRTLSFKVISLSSLNFDIQLCFARVQSNFKNSTVFKLYLQGKYICHFHSGYTCKLISLGFSWFHCFVLLCFPPCFNKISISQRISP